jgi:hypothetical protein
MKAYGVHYMDSHGVVFDGWMVEWYSSKVEAIARAKTIAAWRDVDDNDIDDEIRMSATHQVHGVSQVEIPTSKRALIPWLNNAECRHASLGRVVWEPKGGK